MGQTQAMKFLAAGPAVRIATPKIWRNLNSMLCMPTVCELYDVQTSSLLEATLMCYIIKCNKINKYSTNNAQQYK
jgi:hypothetical protein